jgi:hypothetical protein
MNNDEAIQFLQSNQPMPNDLDITQNECDLFIESMHLLTKQLDIRCIPLFINSVSKNTGMGMYETISSVLLGYPKQDVISFLKEGFTSTNSGVIYRCCWWAIGLDAWELESCIKPLLISSDEDIREVAVSFMELKNENV